MTTPVPRRSVKTRADLKRYFANGSVPSQTEFADLIDSLAHVDELPAPAPPHPPAPVSRDTDPPGLRIGRFDPQAPHARRLLRTDELVQGCSQPADGRWYEVVGELTDCYAFDIVACASAMPGTGWHGVTHAVALCAVGKRTALRQSHTGARLGWGWLAWLLRVPRVEFAWHAAGRGVALRVRSSRCFGQDEQGRQVMIDYHLTRLW